MTAGRRSDPVGSAKPLVSRLFQRLRYLTGGRRRCEPPVLVGGTGGSGTRVVAEVLRSLGFDLGRPLNHAHDSIELTNFIRRWIGAYLAPGGVPPARRAAMARDLEFALFLHGEGRRGDGGWVAKDPRTALMLPYFDAEIAGVRYIHLVRDGRDMAFSRNQNQLEAYGSLLLGPDLARAPAPVRSIALWQTVNLRTRAYGAGHMGGRYLLVRFEDLCGQPLREAERLRAFLGAAGSPADAAAAVSVPDSIGRWRLQPPEMAAAVTQAGSAGLEAFGYIGVDG